MNTPAGGLDLAWTQHLLSVIDEGRRVATYKLAVLLGLIDECVLGSDAAGGAPTAIGTNVLARRVIELYWPQVRPYPKAETAPLLLRQTTGTRAVTVDAVRELHAAAGSTGARSVAAARQSVPAVYERVASVVELNLVRMPLGKLQRPQGFRDGSSVGYQRFLYDDSAMHEGVTAAQLPLSIELRPGVSEQLASLAGLLRPLIQFHWTHEVARYNKHALGYDGLHDFLFGVERVGVGPVRRALVELQANRCFYCRLEMADRVDVDHFIPWSRLPNNGLANLVATHPTCNSSKSDHLADLELLQRWGQRDVGALSEVGRDLRWPVEDKDSRGAARGLYAHLPTATGLWSGPGNFALLNRERLAEVLPYLEDP